LLNKIVSLLKLVNTLNMKLFLLLIITALFSCNDNLDDQYWQKGNLHTHSFWSDGDDFPEMIIDWYKENDYQFIALSWFGFL